MKKTLMSVVFAALLLVGIASTFVLADGSDPMPACRNKVCPPAMVR